MEKDEIKDLETTETSETMTDKGEEVAPEGSEKENSETEQEEFVLSTVEEPETVEEETVEEPQVEAVLEEEEEVPTVETAAEGTSERTSIEPPQDSQSTYADEPFLADNQVKSKINTKWNWGAMALPVFFGIANRSYLGLLSLLVIVPGIGWVFGIAWAIVFGINGERWALQNPDNRYRDEEEFRKIMDGWNRAGLVAFIIGVAAVIFMLLFFIMLGAAIFSSIDQSQY